MNTNLNENLLSYTAEVPVRVGDLNGLGSLKPSGVLALFQEAADAHARLLGLHIDDLLKYGKSWVIVRLRLVCSALRITAPFVTVTTWPVQAGRADCDRDFIFRDGGEEIVRGSAKYCVIDAAEKRIEPLSALKSYPQNCLTDRAFPGKIARAERFQPQGEAPAYTYNVGMSDVDVNGHMNNVRYADMAYNALAAPGRENVTEFAISYLAECRRGDEVQVYTQNQSQSSLCLGRARGIDIFAAELKFEQK